jgi:hypothetical protein
MNTLIHCIYSSRSNGTFRTHDIPALLASARANNLRCGITGILMVVDRSFFHVLEGEREDVDETFSRISSDPRHSNVTQIIREPIAARSFGEWTLGFSGVSFRQLGELMGETDFFTDASCLERLGSGRARKLLMAFQSGGWRADETGVFEFRNTRTA